MAELIRNDGHLAGCRITLTFSVDNVTIEGEVRTFYQKSLAQSFVMQALAKGALRRRVENHLAVR